jgi:hypothetical protein
MLWANCRCSLDGGRKKNIDSSVEVWRGATGPGSRCRRYDYPNGLRQSSGVWKGQRVKNAGMRGQWWYTELRGTWTWYRRPYSKISSEHAPSARNQFSNTEPGDFHALGAWLWVFGVLRVNFRIRPKRVEYLLKWHLYSSANAVSENVFAISMPRLETAISPSYILLRDKLS